MIEMNKGYKVGDVLIYYHRNGQFKNMKAPQEVILREISQNVIGTNHTVVDVKSHLQFFSHESSLYLPAQLEMVMGKYYRDVSSVKNSLPRKLRKAIRKYSDKFPEYII